MFKGVIVHITIVVLTDDLCRDRETLKSVATLALCTPCFKFYQHLQMMFYSVRIIRATIERIATKPKCNIRAGSKAC
jgi:hypothetical protein